MPRHPFKFTEWMTVLEETSIKQCVKTNKKEFDNYA